jgi:hypothetical protein
MGSLWRHLEAPKDQGQQSDPPPKPARQKANDDLTARIKELELALGSEEQARAEAQAEKLQALEARYAVERVERARAQAQVQFPKADQELLAEYPSQDPEVILSYAAKLHEKASLAMYSMNGMPLPPSNASEAAMSQEESQIRRWQHQVRNNHLRKTLDPIEADQAFETFFARGWNQHMDARKRRAGLPIAPISTSSG